jgi:parallel beta-helix repeat protein
MLSLAFNIRPVKSENSTIIVPDDYPTIQAAINAASAGGTVFVEAGVYNENIVVNKTIALIGENESTTIIDGSVQITQTSNVEINGFEIQSDVTIRFANTVTLVGNVMNGISTYCNYGVDNITGNTIYGGIGMVESAGGIFRNNMILYGISGQYYIGSNTIIGNNITGGIAITPYPWSSQQTIVGNTISGGGIVLGEYCVNSNISNNVITNSRFGIDLSTYISSGTVFNNTIANTVYGIYLECSDNFAFECNKIEGCTYSPITLQDSEGNLFYHNDFINNSYWPNTGGTYNTWDDGYPSGGNYWSNYRTLYPNASEIDSSGIWNTSYVIDANNIDRYPLMDPWPSHDIAITSVATSKTIVGQGYSLNTTVTVANRGDYTETFNVTLYTNTTAIATQTVTLASRKSTTLTFTWNTTGFAIGNYIMSAYVHSVPGETNLADNTYIGGTVRIDTGKLGIASVTVSPTTVYQGDHVTVNIIIHNGLDYLATCKNITVYANETIIATITNMNVNPHANITITVTMATDLPYGKYTINAELYGTTVISGKNLTFSDSYAGGTVLVTIPGDINGDGKVDSTDFIIFLAAYGFGTGQPAYNPACDLNHDGKVDSTDFIIFLANYGKSI